MMTKTMEKWGAQSTSFKLVAVNRTKNQVKDADGKIYSIKNLSTAEEKGIVSTKNGETYEILKPELAANQPTLDGIWLFRTREQQATEW